MKLWKVIIILAVLWVACAVFDRGYLLGGLTMQSPAYKHDGFVDIFCLAGPFALPEATMEKIDGAPYMWHGYTCQQRWAANRYKRLGFGEFARDNMDCRDFNPEVSR